MQRIAEQTQQELTIENLLEINRQNRYVVDRFKPEIKISFDGVENKIDVVLKLNGKTISTEITEKNMEYYSVEDQIKLVVDDLIDPFKTMLGDLISRPISILNQNKNITGATL